MKVCIAVLVLGIALCCAGTSFAAESYNGHYYDIVDGSWLQAENASIALGGHLVTVNDQAEQDWLIGTFGAGNNYKYWLGLNDAANEGTFVWASGETSEYTNWDNNAGNNANKDYVAMFSNGKWHVVKYDTADVTRGIAEFAPEPISAGLFLLGGGALAVIRKKRKA